MTAWFALSMATARADMPETSFQSGGWQGSAIAQNGVLAFCAMSAVYGKADSAIVLTIGLDRSDGWMVAINGSQFSFPAGRIALGLAFDDQPPIDVDAQAATATRLAFRVQGADTFDRHTDAPKNSTLRFPAGPRYRSRSTGFLRRCRTCGKCVSDGRSISVGQCPEPPPSPAASPASSVSFGTLAGAKVEVRAKPAIRFNSRLGADADGLPVEILGTQDSWKQVRTSDGTEGWIRGNALSDARGVLVINPALALRQAPQAEAAIVARLEPGVIARVSRCDGVWCELTTHGYRGWSWNAGRAMGYRHERP